MSGSRTANQELVFCHACQNEFYKERESLTCPQCHSDFTEVIDPNFDPRGEVEDPSNAWEQDPGEADIEEITHNHGPGWRNDNTDPQGYMRGDPFRNSFETPLFGDFASMINSITGRPLPPGQYQNRNRPPPSLYTPPLDMQPPQGSTRNRERPMSTGPQVYTRSFTSGGGGVHISFSSSTGGGWRTNATQGGELHDINDIFQSMFQVGGPMGAGRGGQPGQPPNPLAAIFGSILNPANAQHGDAVFSQEAFDRVMSQLMDQHTTGTAPGPASEAAIASLPTKKVSEDMLDENTHQAECSICMENVTLGETVTVLPCQHWFHHECVAAWLKEHDTCPVCRSGIMPKDGGSDAPRTPQQAPLHDEDPFLLARQQSGSRAHPFVVPESPARDRRRPAAQRHSTDRSQGSESRRSGDGDGGISFTGRVRSFFGGGGSNNSNSNHNSNDDSSTSDRR